MGNGARQVLKATVSLRMVLNALSVGLVVIWLLGIGHIGPGQDGEHARKRGKSKEGLHGKEANQLTIESQPAPEKALLQSAIQCSLVLA